MKGCLYCCSYFKHKHIILTTTFRHSTFSNYCLIFGSAHSNNPKNDHPRLLCTTALNNSLNSECFMLNQTLTEYCHSFENVFKAFKYFIHYLNHVFRYNFISQL